MVNGVAVTGDCVTGLRSSGDLYMLTKEKNVNKIIVLFWNYI